MKTPTGGRFAPPSQVPPLSFPFSFSFQFPFNLNYETTRLKTGSRTPATTQKRRTKKKRKKQSVSQTIDLVVAIKTHTESSKSELSSGTFDHFKVSRVHLLRRPINLEKSEASKSILVEIYCEASLTCCNN